MHALLNGLECIITTFLFYSVGYLIEKVGICNLGKTMFLVLLFALQLIQLGSAVSEGSGSRLKCKRGGGLIVIRLIVIHE